MRIAPGGPELDYLHGDAVEGGRVRLSLQLRVPIIPTSKATPDLSKIDEIGFSDLMEGGWIPATSRVAAFELYGKVVPRKAEK